MSIFLLKDYFFTYSGYNINRATKILPMCCTVDNTLVPIFAALSGSYIHHGNKRALIYNLALETATLELPRSPTRFITSFHSGTPKVWKTPGDPENRIFYYTLKHFIFTYINNEINPLYALCAAPRDLFVMNRDNFSYNKMFLLLSPNLSLNENKYLYGRVKPLIAELKALGVNVMITSNIKDICLRETIFKSQFSTIEERKHFIQLMKVKIGLPVELLPPIPKKEEPIITPAPVTEPEISVIDDTVVRASDHQRVGAGFIDRDVFPITEPRRTRRTHTPEHIAERREVEAEMFASSGQVIITGTGGSMERDITPSEWLVPNADDIARYTRITTNAPSSPTWVNISAGTMTTVTWDATILNDPLLTSNNQSDIPF